MKRVAILVLVVAFLVLAGAGLAQPGDSELPPPYVVEADTVSGGDYQLTGQGASAAVEMSGGAYRLQGGVQPMLRGNGCCCTYLPCILRQ